MLCKLSRWITVEKSIDLSARLARMYFHSNVLKARS